MYLFFPTEKSDGTPRPVACPLSRMKQSPSLTTACLPRATATAWLFPPLPPSPPQQTTNLLFLGLRAAAWPPATDWRPTGPQLATGDRLRGRGPNPPATDSPETLIRRLCSPHRSHSDQIRFAFTRSWYF